MNSTQQMLSGRPQKTEGEERNKSMWQERGMLCLFSGLAQNAAKQIAAE